MNIGRMIGKEYWKRKRRILFGNGKIDRWEE